MEQRDSSISHVWSRFIRLSLTYDKKMFLGVQHPYLVSVLETGGPESWPRPGPKLFVCVCVLDLHAAVVLLRCSFTHQCVCAPGSRHYKWPRECLLIEVNKERTRQGDRQPD